MRGSASAALRCDARLAILERSENAKRKESLLNALLVLKSYTTLSLLNSHQAFFPTLKTLIIATVTAPVTTPIAKLN